MKKLNSRWIVWASLVAGLGLASSAHADWNLVTDSSGGSSISIIKEAGVYATNGGTFTNATTYAINGFGSGATWKSDIALTNYSGAGVGLSSDGSSTPNHAIDNGPQTNSSGTKIGIGNTEGVLLNFSSSVVLTSIGLGYVSGDYDFSLFRYTGSSATPPLFTPGASFAGGATPGGWSLVSNYSNTVVGGQTTANVATGDTNLGSSWWLISAYNTSYGGSGMTQGDDYFKVLTVAGTACLKPSSTGVCGGGGSSGDNKVPEPASLALVGLGLIGLMVTRRRAHSSKIVSA